MHRVNDENQIIEDFWQVSIPGEKTKENTVNNSLVFSLLGCADALIC